MDKFKFVVTQSTIGGHTVNRAIVRHSRSINRDTAIELAYQKTGYQKAKVLAVFEGLARAIKETIDNSNKAKVLNFASFFEVCKGSFATSQGPWVKGVNYLEVTASPEATMQFALKGIVPVNSTESTVNPIVNSIYNPDKEEFDVIALGKTIVINGQDLVPDLDAEDEGVFFVPDSGAECRFPIDLSEDAQVIAVAPLSGFEAGAKGKIEVRTRSGLGASYGLKIASRRVTAVA